MTIVADKIGCCERTSSKKGGQEGAEEKKEGEKGLQRDMTAAVGERNGERGSQTCRRMQDNVSDYVGR